MHWQDACWNTDKWIANSNYKHSKDVISLCWFSGIFFNIENIGSSLFCFLNYETTITPLQETWKIQTKLYIVPLCIMLSHFSHVQFSVTPWTIAYQASLSMGFSRQESWSGWPYPPPGGLPHPGVEPVSLCLLHWQMDSLPRAPPGKPRKPIVPLYITIIF